MAYTTTIALQDWESGASPSGWTNDGSWSSGTTTMSAAKSVFGSTAGNLYYSAATDGNGGTCQFSGYIRFPATSADLRVYAALVPGGSTATCITNLGAGTWFHLLVTPSNTTGTGTNAGVTLQHRIAGVSTNIGTSLTNANILSGVWYYWQITRAGQVLTAYVQDTTTGKWLTSSNTWSSTTAKVAFSTVTDSVANSVLNPATASIPLLRSAGSSPYVDYCSFEAGNGATPLPTTIPAVGNASAGTGGSGLWSNPDVWAPAGSGYYPCQPFSVTGAANNGSGLVRLTVTGHPYVTGDVAYVAGVGGVTGAAGKFTLTSIDANTVDLQSSTFGGTYTTGGTVSRADIVSIGAAASVSTPDGSSYAVGTGSGTALTVYGAFALGQGTASSAGTGGQLTLRGNATVTASKSLVVKRGGVLNFDTAYGAFSVTLSDQAILDCTDGTSGAHITITSVGGTSANNGHLAGAGSAGGAYTLGQIKARYTDFSNLASASTSSISADCGIGTSSTGQGVFLHNVTFTSCGQVYLVPKTGGYASIQNGRWFSSLVNGTTTFPLSISTGTALSGGTREVLECTWDVPPSFNGPSLTVNQNLFTNPYSYGLAAWAQFSGNLCSQAVTSGFTPLASSSNNYYLTDPSTSFGNPHFFKLPSGLGNLNVTGDIFEYSLFATDGDTAIAPDAASAQSVVMTYSLKLPNAVGTSSGTAFSALGTAYTTFTLEHNTIHLGGASESSGFRLGETVATHAGEVASCRANLAWDSTPRGWILLDISGTPGTDAVAVANCDYNAGYNVASANCTFSDGPHSVVGYYGLKFSGASTTAPGAHDLHVNPGFVDPYRNLPRFDRDYLGNTATRGAWAAGTSYSVGDTVNVTASGYYNGATLNFRCINAHTSVAGDSVLGSPGVTATTQAMSIVNGTPTTGNCWITVFWPNLTTSTTAQIPWNSTAAAAATLVGTALSGSGVTVTGSSGGPFPGTPIVLTFSQAIPLLLHDGGDTLDHGISAVPYWRSNWEFASYESLRTAIQTGARITDASLGLSGATYLDALRAWVRAGLRPTNAALSGATYPGDTATLDAAGNALGGTIGAMAYGSAALTMGSAPTLTVTGPHTIGVAWSAATAGTSPYTYQVQRAPDVTGSPGTYANVGSSGSGLSYSDVGLDPGTVYHYRVVATDAVAATANSPDAHATTTLPDIPNYALWWSRMTSVLSGTMNPIMASLTDSTFSVQSDLNHDGIYGALQGLALRPGNSDLTTYAGYQTHFYRDAYLLAGSPPGQAPGYYLFPEGLADDWTTNASATSQTALADLRANGVYVTYGDTSTEGLSRENAYALLTQMEADRTGTTAWDASRVTTLVTNALGHIALWLSDPSIWNPSTSGNGYIQPFMMGITGTTLAKYLDYIEGSKSTTDARIVPALAALAVRLRRLWWRSASGDFIWPIYPDGTDHAPAASTDELNLETTPFFGWLYNRTGLTYFKTAGDESFGYGIDTASGNLDYPKKWNQQYRWSFLYATWRQATPGTENGFYVCDPPFFQTGTVGVPSGNFAVQPMSAITATITPSDGGAGGAFSPASLTFSASADAQTFTYTSGAAGTVTITLSSGGALTDPASLTYTASVVTTSAAKRWPFGSRRR